MLVDTGALSPKNLRRVLAMQSRVEARFGDILLARGLIDRTRLYATLGRQYDAEIAQFDSTPPDIRLVEAYGLERCLRTGILPWRKADGHVIVATARPEQFAEQRPELEALFGPVRMAITGELELHRAILNDHPRVLAARAETRVPAAESCRDYSPRASPKILIAAATMLAGLVLLAPVLAFFIFAGLSILILALNTALKLTVAIRHLAARPEEPEDDPGAPIIARLPAVSLLVPLYKEREIAGHLIKRLARLDYPRELLDICLVVEADDQVTCDTLDGVDLPAHMRQIVVPHGTLKTKPRALNYALDFCRGSIVGVYDAEDAPAPDQIMRIVQRFHQRGREVACLQGVLDFYNARSNWLSRCFTLEYAMWFRIMLPGLVRLGLVIPLGGTTLFFRRSVLVELGGWDAYNVTEDADLGIRLARHGYRTELIDTVTEEEANCRVWPWIRQRSRWLKGYAITWAVHMRDPRRLLRELGAWRFLGVQILFLGTVCQFLLAPLLWSFWMIFVGLPHPFSQLATTGLFWGVIGIFMASELVGALIGVLAVNRPKHRFLIPWIPTLFFYFPLAALAGYKGILELMTRPFFWDKTEHGLFELPPESEEPVRNPPAQPIRRRA
jgi:cellulose synthase/poly-beta-1,6-N-acetylglucosamine synthase-like glycosyltransferase